MYKSGDPESFEDVARECFAKFPPTRAESHATRIIRRFEPRCLSLIASGDLSSEIAAASRDETGQLIAALGHMNASLMTIIGQVRTSAGVITTASTEIASGSLDLSARTEQQAGALEETASSMEQLTASVQNDTAHAGKCND